MSYEEKIRKIEALFGELLLKDHDIENISVKFPSYECMQIRTEATILKLGTFAVKVQNILENRE